MAPSTRLPILVRRSQVLELVLQGRTYEQICFELNISEDTVARDMKAIADEVQQLVKERTGEILAVALAHLQRVLDRAWAEYDADLDRERAWHAGTLDYVHEDVATKTLALQGQADADMPIESESLPLEVKRTRRTIRPTFMSNRAQWLKLIVETTRELTELTGVKKLLIEHTGKNGAPLLEAFGTAVDKIYGVEDGSEC